MNTGNNADNIDAQVVVDEPIPQGAFFESLNRNNKTIKQDRATSITEDVQTYYKRAIEDMRLTKKRLTRDRVNMLDLSPSDKNSLILAGEFDSKRFIEEDLRIGVDLRNLNIKLDIAEASYQHLFGERA